MRKNRFQLAVECLIRHESALKFFNFQGPVLLLLNNINVKKTLSDMSNNTLFLRIIIIHRDTAFKISQNREEPF